MHRELRFTPTADQQLTYLENTPALKGALRQVRKTLGYLETNPRNKSLQTHEFESLTRRYKRKIFEAYAQQNTPSTYSVFWQYGDDEIDKKGNRIPIITVVDIAPYPKE